MIIVEVWSKEPRPCIDSKKAECGNLNACESNPEFRRTGREGEQGKIYFDIGPCQGILAGANVGKC